MSKNRIGGLFSGGGKESPNRFKHILFEKFDPKIIRQVSKEIFGEEGFEDYEEGDEDEQMQGNFVGQKLTVHQESQLLDFNFWMMHTNVDISPRMVLLIEEIQGIESIDVVSRYRARVGIAKLFNEDTVKSAISDAINNLMDKVNG